MALAKCKECGREVSTEAKICPSCGVANPTTRPGMSKGAGCLLAFLLLIILGAIVNSASDHAASTSSSSLNADLQRSAAETPPAVVPPETRAAQIAAAGSGDCHPKKARVLALARKHRAWSDEALGVVACHQVQAGLTEAQMIASWGRPEKVNSTVVGQTETQQWVYGDNYVYVEDGVVTSYQTSQ